jgi:cysteine desulfurase family protein (TIGR01976 family)
MTPFSSNEIAAIRSEFPALQNNFVFLDNAGGSQVLKRVADRIYDYLTTTSVQLGASYANSVAAGEKVLAARRSVAELVNAYHDEEIVMNGSTTASMYFLTQAILPSLKAGDEIIVTNTDHEANIGAWMRMRQVGIIVKMWEVNRDTFDLELSELDNLITARTKWVAMTHASNVLGTVNPVAEVAQRVHAVGGRLCVDGVAYAPHRLVDVRATGADVYVFSFYKVFGPHYGMLWGKRDFLLSLPGLNHHFIGDEVLPYKLQPGNVNFELSYGCMGIGDYYVAMGELFSGKRSGQGSRRELMQTALDRFAQHEDYLAEKLLSFLRGKKQVRIIGIDNAQGGLRMPTISFVVKNQLSENVVRYMDQYNIGIRFGDFYAKYLIETLGLQEHGGVVRISIAHYNSVEEIEALVMHLNRFLTSLG